jgi:hypothetical protein
MRGGGVKREIRGAEGGRLGKGEGNGGDEASKVAAQPYGRGWGGKGGSNRTAGWNVSPGAAPVETSRGTLPAN